MKPTVLLFFALLAVYANAQVVKTEYYRRLSFDDRQYTIVPHNKIDSATAKKTTCYKVDFDGQNRIKHIRYQSFGEWSVDNSRVSDMHIVYTDSTELRYIDYPSRYQNNTAYRVRLEKIVLNRDKNPVSVIYYGKDGNLSWDRYCVTRYERILNSDGWAVELRFYDAYGRRISNSNGDYFYRIEWKNDSIFYRPEFSYYDKSGNLHDGKRGYAVIQSSFYKAGERNPYENRYFNAQRQPVSKNYAISRREYYDNGLIKTVSYFDKNEKPANNKDGYSLGEYEYNEYGNITRQILYTKNTAHYIEYSVKYNDNQQRMEASRKTDGIKLTGNKKKIALVRYEYDDTGKCIFSETFNAKGKSIMRTAF